MLIHAFSFFLLPKYPCTVDTLMGFANEGTMFGHASLAESSLVYAFVRDNSTLRSMAKDGMSNGSEG